MVPQTLPIFLTCKEKAAATKWRAPGNKLINMGGQWGGSNKYVSHKLLSHACNWIAKHWIAQKLLMADELCRYDRFVSEDYLHDIDLSLKTTFMIPYITEKDTSEN